MNTMTLEQVRDWHHEIFKSTNDPKHKAASDALDAHLTRQSEGLSDDEVWKAARALFNARKNNLPLGTDLEKHWNKEKGNYFIDAQCALTAVWHNRPAQESCPFCGKVGMHPLGETCLNNTPSFDLADAAQEKAQPVAEVVAAESDDGYLIPKHARLLNEAARKLPVGTKLYTAQPAGRVRVPDVVAIMEHLPDNRAATRAELIRAMALSAAPKTNRHDTPTPPAE